MTDTNGAARLDRFALVCLIILAALKIHYSFAATPFPDEAYYWLWGQHLDFSYFDHPPLQAWVQRLFGPITSGSCFGLRFPALLVTAGLATVIWWWAREARRHGHAVSTVLALAVFFATPNFYIFTTVVFPDYLAMILVSLSALLFFNVLDRVAAGGKVTPAPLYGAALALGLAVLTKYNSAFFGVAVALAIIVHRPFRPALSSPHLYAAAALCAVCLAPVLYWNYTHDWASFQYNLDNRLHSDFAPAVLLDHIWSFASNSLLGFSLFLHFGIAALLWRRPADAWLNNWRVLAIAGFLVPTLFWIGAVAVTRPESYWNIVAYVPLMPLIVLWMPRIWVKVAHLGLGVVCAIIVNIHFAVVPISTLLGGASAEADGVYGWRQIAEAVERHRVSYRANFIATTYYRTGADLSFELGRTDVEVISDRRSQFDFWFDERGHAGQDAVILADDRHQISDMVRQRFATIERVDIVEVKRFGYHIRNYQIFIGRNYIPRK